MGLDAAAEPVVHGSQLQRTLEDPEVLLDSEQRLVSGEDLDRVAIDEGRPQQVHPGEQLLLADPLLAEERARPVLAELR